MKAKWTQRLNPIFLLYQNRAIKISKQKSCVSKINDACNQRKTRLALLITRESLEQDAPCQTENCYWRDNCLTLTQTTRQTFSKRKIINLENYVIYAPAIICRMRVYATVTKETCVYAGLLSETCVYTLL